MTELAVVTILAGVLAVGVALAALIFSLLQRQETHIDDRSDRVERRLDEIAERVARLAGEEASPEEQPGTGRGSAFDRSPPSFRG